MSVERPAPARDLGMITGRLLPALRALVRTGYFRVEVEGAERVPRQGPMIYVGNHAGWFTMDTLFGALVVTDHVGAHRLPFGAVQDAALKVPVLGRFLEGLGGFPATWLREPDRLPAAMEVFSVYPEGTEGNCKPFWQAYQMRSWRSGFLRLALARRAAIVPIAVVGGEESLPVAATIRFLKPVFGSIMPLPMSVLPLPARWKFVFHPPVSVEALAREWPQLDAAEQQLRLWQLADDIRAVVQHTLDGETAGHRLVRLGAVMRQFQALARTERAPAAPPEAAVAARRPRRRDRIDPAPEVAFR